MIKLLVIVTLMITLSGCVQNTIGLPKIDNSHSTIYITHLKENAITSIQLDSDTQMKVSLPFAFSSIVEIKPGYFIASVKEENQLYKIDLNEHSIAPLMKVDTGILELQYDLEKELLYAANSTKNSILTIDIQKKKVLNETMVGEYPSKLVLHEHQLFVLAAGSGEVFVLDTEKNEKHSFQVNQRPEGLHFDGNFIWIGGHGPTGEMNENVFAYDVNTGQQIHAIKTGLMPIQISQENEAIYVISHGDHSLTKINTNTYEVEQKIHIGDNPNYMIMDEDFIYVSSLDGDEVLIVNKNTLEITKKYDVKNGPFLLFKGGEMK
ncbi:MAG: hypothetical protein LPK00_00690 [Bacillaceae bacterium]|nr:hypothetical protein [Bacillaceae bacterium]